MRLIDADDLLERFKYGEADTDEEILMISAVRRMIREQPTAVDEVMKLVDDIIDEVIETVKKGGVE